MIECMCDERARQRYTQRLSGPLLDRFDLRIAVRRPNVDDLLDQSPGESSADVARRVRSVREASLVHRGLLNAHLDETALNRHATLDPSAERLIRSEMERGRLTGRGYHRVRRVARTLADLSGGVDASVGEDHVATALTMRARVGLAAVEQAA